MKTYSAKPKDIKLSWHVIDADGKILGKVAAEAAKLLQGKHKAIYSRNLDTGDGVIVVNAAKFLVTGKKLTDKMYYRHSGYPGGFREANLEEVMSKKPTFAMERAIKGMLPHNRLGAAMYKKLRVYAGSEHPHKGQLVSLPVQEG